jgi:hypothetical protein
MSGSPSFQDGLNQLAIVMGGHLPEYTGRVCQQVADLILREAELFFKENDELLKLRTGVQSLKKDTKMGLIHTFCDFPATHHQGLIASSARPIPLISLLDPAKAMPFTKVNTGGADGQGAFTGRAQTGRQRNTCWSGS